MVRREALSLSHSLPLVPRPSSLVDYIGGLHHVALVALDVPLMLCRSPFARLALVLLASVSHSLSLPMTAAAAAA